MANRSKRYQGYSMSEEAIRLMDYVSSKTLAPKSRLVEKAITEYYAEYLKEMKNHDN